MEFERNIIVMSNRIWRQRFK